MDRQTTPLKVTTGRLVQAAKNLANSEVGWKAKAMFGALVALLCAVNGLNVVNSYVGRNFMTAIADRDRSEFVRQAAFYIGVFAASTVVSVIVRFAEERLGLLWREFLSRRAIGHYLANSTYHRLDVSGELANVDQRIGEDIRAFAATTLSFVLMALNSGLTVVAFAGVLWLISPLLFIVAVIYAVGGSYLTIALGRPLIALNYNQLDKEASFRSGLIHVRENAESIMLTRSERRHATRLEGMLEDLVSNFRTITSINRNVGFFTTGYNWMIQIIPALIIAPAFIDGKIEFGVISQSAMAFSSLVAALSLIVTQFQSLSNFAAVVARLSSLLDAFEKPHSKTAAGVEIVEEDGRLAYEALTLLSSPNGGVLLKDLTLSIPSLARVLLTGSNPAAGAALFRATAGLLTAGSGRIIRPGEEKMLFLAQRPYLPPGTLRQILVRKEDISDEQVLDLLRRTSLEQILTQAGGLDTEQDWKTLLPLREQQLLAFIAIIVARPQFVFLDQVGAILGQDYLRKVLQLLTESSIGYVNAGEPNDATDLFSAVLACEEGGQWRWSEVRPAPMTPARDDDAKTTP
jgi:vitamin B12/bleomycin/antimicrobial peptide transport system ATP-binding/permease protein